MRSENRGGGMRGRRGKESRARAQSVDALLLGSSLGRSDRPDYMNCTYVHPDFIGQLVSSHSRRVDLLLIRVFHVVGLIDPSPPPPLGLPPLALPLTSSTPGGSTDRLT